MNLRFFRIGAWLWIITGVVHSAGDLRARLFPSAAKEPVRAALRDLPFEILGMTSNYYKLTMGFSLLMGASIALVGVLLLMIARLTADNPLKARSACLVGVAASLGLLVIAATVLQLPPPIVTFSLASLAFTVALFTSSSARAAKAA